MKTFFKALFLALFSLFLCVLLAIRYLDPPKENRASTVDYRITEADLILPTPSPEVREPDPTPAPTPVPTPEPTPEPQPDYFTISIIGDLTLASHQKTNDYSAKMNGDYAYPFSNTVQYFAEDDLTIGNLECTFTDQALYSSSTFYFRSPSAWANILTEGSVEFVTTANNHTNDFGQTGVTDTQAALDAVGVLYGTDGQSQIIETESGLKVGIFCAYNGYKIKEESCLAAIAQLKEDGAEYIIMAFHWGQEKHYKPDASQVQLAQSCIDAGADLIYGCHPHVLAPLVEYNNGIILYSMGNFSFGGNTNPTDKDTAIVQVSVRRDPDGTISTDSYTVIPCCISSNPYVNNYCPTPYEEGSEEYERVMSKLDMNSSWANQTADYSGWHESYG